MATALWGWGESTLEEGGSYKLWGRVGGRACKLGKGVPRCGLWRGICMGWKDFSQHTRFEIRVGNRVRFWHDFWCGDSHLWLTFLVVYEIATNKEVFVALSLTRQRKGERRTWDVRFTQDLNDWEVGEWLGSGF